MDRRSKKKIKYKYLRKIDTALKNLNYKRGYNPSTSDRIKLLLKLGKFVKEIDYTIFWELKKEIDFPKNLIFGEKEIENFFSGTIHRELAFKTLDI